MSISDEFKEIQLQIDLAEKSARTAMSAATKAKKMLDQLVLEDAAITVSLGDQFMSGIDPKVCEPGGVFEGTVVGERVVLFRLGPEDPYEWESLKRFYFHNEVSNLVRLVPESDGVSPWPEMQQVVEAVRERDEAVARAEAAERDLADEYSEANQNAAAWERVVAHPALKMDLLTEADHTYAGRVFERITQLAETEEAVTEMQSAPAVTRADVERVVCQVFDRERGYRRNSLPWPGTSPVTDAVCVLFGIGGDRLEVLAGELYEVVNNGIEWSKVIESAKEGNSVHQQVVREYRTIAAHVLGQEDKR